jgi:hypothetical protein
VGDWNQSWKGPCPERGPRRRNWNLRSWSVKDWGISQRLRALPSHCEALVQCLELLHDPGVLQLRHREHRCPEKALASHADRFIGDGVAYGIPERVREGVQRCLLNSQRSLLAHSAGARSRKPGNSTRRFLCNFAKPRRNFFQECEIKGSE